MKDILVNELLNEIILTILNEIEYCKRIESQKRSFEALIADIMSRRLRMIEPEMTEQNNLLYNLHWWP